jgi:hypothetical protein
VHRTVQCATHAPANGRPRDQRMKRGSANGQKVAPDCPVCHEGRWLQWSASTKKEGNHTLFTVRWCAGLSGAPTIEGNQGLPNGTQTAPSCLVAIKGTPRRIEDYTKQSLNIQQRQDIEFTLLL